MQCDICAKKKATVHLTEIVDEQMSEMHLCEDCAHQKSAQMEQQFGLADLLAGLSSTSAGGKDPKEGTLVCSSCGLNYEDFRKFGRLGCTQCYTSFKEHLSGLLRKIHGSSRHLGKMPYSLKSKTSPDAVISTPAALLASENLEDLRKQLHNAITNEDFEKAAMLRDKIKDLEA
jgi:protein arginine kinase activator